MEETIFNGLHKIKQSLTYNEYREFVKWKFEGILKETHEDPGVDVCVDHNFRIIAYYEYNTGTLWYMR